jgi:DHA2 family multidrug resistance protein
MLVRHEQVHRNNLVDSMAGTGRVFQQQYQAMWGYLSQHAAAATAGQQAYKMMDGMLNQQAALLSFVDDFRYLALLCFACAPIAFAMKRVRGRGRSSLAH